MMMTTMGVRLTRRWATELTGSSRRRAAAVGDDDEVVPSDGVVEEIKDLDEKLLGEVSDIG